MFEREDPLDAFRGIALGVLLGIILWSGIGLLFYFFA